MTLVFKRAELHRKRRKWLDEIVRLKAEATTLPEMPEASVEERIQGLWWFLEHGLMGVKSRVAPDGQETYELIPTMPPG